MRLIFIVLFFITQSAFADFVEPSKSAECVLSSSSQWKWGLEKLVRSTDNIFIGELISSAPSSDPYSIVSDFSNKPDMAAHGKPEKYGNRQNLQQNDVWKSTRWTFRIEEWLKSKNMNDTKEVTFVSAEWSKQKPPGLTPIFCDYALSFNKGKKYLIFLNSFNPYGYQEVAGKDDPYYKKIGALLKRGKK